MSRAHSRTVIDAIMVGLKAIHTDNGDSFTPSIVQRFDEDRSVRGPPWAIFCRLRLPAREREETGAGFWTRLTLDIFVNVYSGEGASDASDERIEEADEDVWRAVAAVDWKALRAEFKEYRAITYREEDAELPIAGFRAEIDVEYKVAYDNPDTIINL